MSQYYRCLRENFDCILKFHYIFEDHDDVDPKRVNEKEGIEQARRKDKRLNFQHILAYFDLTTEILRKTTDTNI